MPRTAAPRARRNVTLPGLPRLVDLLAARADEHDREGGFPYQGVEALDEAGVLAFTAPERHGGSAAGPVAALHLVGELGRGDPSVALLASDTLLLHAVQARTPFWPARLYRALLADGRHGPQLLAVLDAVGGDGGDGGLGGDGVGGDGSVTDATVLAVPAGPRPGDGYRLSGRALDVVGAEERAWFVVAAPIGSVEPDEAAPVVPRASGGVSAAVPPPTIGVFLVPRDAPGVGVEPGREPAGLRAGAGSDLVLDDVPVTAEASLLCTAVPTVVRPSAGPPEDGADGAAREREPGSEPDAGPEPGASSGPEASVVAPAEACAALVELLAWRQLASAAVGLGIARAARDWVLARLRRHGGSPLPSAAVALGRVEADLACADELLQGLARRLADRDPAAVARVPLVRRAVLDAADRVLTDVAALTGRAALDRAQPLPRHRRDLDALRVELPAPDALFAALGEHLLRG